MAGVHGDQDLYQRFHIVVAATSNLSILMGMLLVLMCGVFMCCRPPSRQVLLVASNALIAHCLHLTASVPLKGFLTVLPRDIDTVDCKVCTFFREMGTYATDTCLIYLVLDRLYSKVVGDGRRNRPVFKIAVYSVTLTWLVAALVSVPVTSVAAVVPEEGHIFPRCRTPLALAVLDGVLKIAFSMMVPICLVTSAMLESGYARRASAVPLMQKTAVLYTLLMVTESPFIIVRLIMAGAGPSLALKYAESFTESFATFRMLLVPIFVYVIGTDHPLDAIGGIFEDCVAQFARLRCRKGRPSVAPREENGEPPRAPPPSVEGRVCKERNWSPGLKWKLVVEKIKSAYLDAKREKGAQVHGSGLQNWVYPSRHLPSNDGAALCSADELQGTMDRTAESTPEEPLNAFGTPPRETIGREEDAAVLGFPVPPSLTCRASCKSYV